MIGKKMEKALNEQINKELYSAYLYLAMAAWAEEAGLSGAANWFRVQFGEETEHAMKFFHYLVEQGSRVVLDAIEKPPVDFKSPLSAFEQTLEHERFVTKSIHGLMDLAIKEADHATASLLRWYVDEQVEEEANAQAIIGQLKLAGQSGGALLQIDRMLGKRKAGGAED